MEYEFESLNEYSFLRRLIVYGYRGQKVTEAFVVKLA